MTFDKGSVDSFEENHTEITGQSAVIRNAAFEADTLQRIVDPDAGVVCYHVSGRDSLCCIPISETNLSLDDDES